MSKEHFCLTISARFYALGTQLIYGGNIILKIKSIRNKKAGKVGAILSEMKWFNDY